MPQDPQQPAKRTFSGRLRQRATSPRVKLANVAARVVITLGGIGTIGAVLLVCIFLVSVVVPLFVPAKVKPLAVHDAAAAQPGDLVHVAVDEYMLLGYAYYRDGTLRTYRIDTGETINEQRPFGETPPTAWSFAITDGHVAFGFADGTVRHGMIGFGARFLDRAALPDEVLALEPGEAMPHEGGMVQKTVENQFRLQALAVRLEDPVEVEAGAAVRLIDIAMKSAGPVIATLTDSGLLHINEISSRKNLLTGKVTTRLTGGRFQLEPEDSRSARWLMVAGLGDNVFVARADGRVVRLDTRNFAAPTVAEIVDLVPEDEATLTALAFQIGKTSLVSGDSAGRVRVWSRIKPEDATTIDGAELVMVHDLPSAAERAAITTLASSSRTRMIASGTASGLVQLFHVTSNQRLAAVQLEQPDAVAALTLTPKDDGILAVTDSHIGLWRIDAPHPETTVSSVFLPVWYEGYAAPEHVWQSSSGTDDFEPKYGLYPLIFGTLKATVYSMLFGVPLALLAAVYTSEMMHPKLKAKIKPTIEMMASLPSVVLGFLAALVVAPFIVDIVPQVLACFVALPFVILLGGYLWQLLPIPVSIRLMKYRLYMILLTLPLGVALGFWVGPVAEAWLFVGDLKGWLTGRIGGGAGGWMFMMIPACALAAAVFSGKVFNPLIRTHTGDWSRARIALLDLGKYLLLVAATIALAYLLSQVLSFAMDPRGRFLDTYVQRNALVVGFVMGFAIIPIIYTISEDALSAVPEHLRSGSLGAGATPWQTAVRIIVPTAMSGLFSALMVGMGRAVGETMIVLMAAGNTPVMEWNIFNGFRTLSANIAVELPEAVKDSTHYRMLFLAALTLFAMTFVVNTIAEVIRLRFRKRAYQL